MNNFRKFLPLLVLALMVLAACAKEQMGQEVKTMVQVQPATEAATDDADTEEMVRESRYGMGLKCSMLKNTQTQQECEVELNDVIGSMLSSEIVSTFDAKRCKELAPAVAADCESKIAAMGVQGPVSEEERAMFAEAIKPVRPEAAGPDAEEAESIYDKTKCAELKTPGYQAYCEKTIDSRMDQDKLGSIVESDNVSRCDELVTESLREDCRAYFGIEPEEVEEETPDEV
ncbi:hypothetical protein JXD20_04765 [Candidatus Peregrinibacteria bacterium]|nr:hypothetical protein [Candidatus Peregrinibacteria bacterium]